MPENTRHLFITRVRPDAREEKEDEVAIEEPLEIRLEWWEGDTLTKKTISITMRTPGHDFDLATGFLYTEGILTDNQQIEAIKHCGFDDKGQTLDNVVKVTLKPGVQFQLDSLERHFYTTSSCGVCGKASIEALKATNCPVIPKKGPQIEESIIYKMPEVLLKAQPVFHQTGGLHASALLNTQGNLIAIREDVGRHNALDKLIGSMLKQEETPLFHNILMLSGRISFELVQKALMAGIPIIGAVGAPSSLAIELAQEHGITLIGFIRGDRFNIYTAAHRIISNKSIQSNSTSTTHEHQ